MGENIDPDFLKVYEKNTIGVIHIELSKYKPPKNIDSLICIVCMFIDSALAISRSYDASRINVYANFENVNSSHFNYTFVTKLFLHMKRNYIEIVDHIHITGMSPLHHKLWDMIEHFVDPPTKKRITIVKGSSK